MTHTPARDDLRKLMEAATPTPWEATSLNGTGEIFRPLETPEGRMYQHVGKISSEHDARLVAALVNAYADGTLVERDTMPPDDPTYGESLQLLRDGNLSLCAQRPLAEYIDYEFATTAQREAQQDVVTRHLRRELDDQTQISIRSIEREKESEARLATAAQEKAALVAQRDWLAAQLASCFCLIDPHTDY